MWGGGGELWIPLRLSVHACMLSHSVVSNSLRPHRLSTGLCREDYWSGLPCPPPGDLPDPGIEPVSPTPPALAGGFFTSKPPGTSLVAQMVKNPPEMRETWVWRLVQEDPLEEDMATDSSILAWRIPRTEGPGGLQSIGLQSFGHLAHTQRCIFPFSRF